MMSDKLLCIKVPTTDVNLLMQIAADPVKATQSRWFRVLPKTLVQTNIGVICYKMQALDFSPEWLTHERKLSLCHFP